MKRRATASEGRSPFRIRAALEGDYTPDHERNERRYRRFIRSIHSELPADLRTYFVLDFFHDGTISRFRYDSLVRTAEMHVVSPNIEQHGKQGFMRFLNVPFVCTFRQIAMIDVRPIEGQFGPYLVSDCRTAEYLHGEVDSMREEIALAAKSSHTEFHSLIMLWDNDVAISMVFAHVKVRPKNSRRFTLLRKRADIVMPILRNVPGRREQIRNR